MSITDRDRSIESLGRIPIRTLGATGITAKAGGTQAAATQLTAQYNKVDTVATDGDSVVLPMAFPGMELTVVNNGAKSLQVFGNAAAGDTINGVATATGVAQMIGSTVIYTCAEIGKWFTEGLASGFSGSLSTISFKDAIVAHAGGTQAGAQGDAVATIVAMLNRVATVGTAADSVVLPAAKPGMQITIANDAAANSLNVFPQTGEFIDAGAANAARAVAAAKTATFFCVAVGKWHSLLSA